MRRGFLRLLLSASSTLLRCLIGLEVSCRFRPSCSQYMGSAVSEHGIFRGVLLGLRRWARCRPSAEGFELDEVPRRLTCGGSGGW